MNQFEETAVKKRTFSPLASPKKMIVRLFQVIEMMIVAVFDGLYKVSSNSLVKAIGKEAFGILFEIFVYLILACCCIVISVMIQAESVLNEGKKEVESAANSEGDHNRPFLLSNF